MTATTTKSETAASNIASVLKRAGAWSIAGDMTVIRDIASFTVIAADGQRFTIAVTPARD